MEKLTVAIRPFEQPVAQDMAIQWVRLYGERVAVMVRDVDRIVATDGDVRKSAVPLVLTTGASDLFKARRPQTPTANASGQPRAKRGEAKNRQYQRPQGGVKSPGSHGGKYYYTKTGKIRYGTQPSEHDAREATPEEVATHFKHYRPSPFAGNDVQQKQLLEAIKRLDKGFTEQDWVFLNWWNKTWRKEFQKWTGLSDADLAGDVSNLVIQDENGQKMTYVEAVHDFFMSQKWGNTPMEEVEKALRGLLVRYEKALHDPAVHKVAQRIAANIDEALYSWFSENEEKTQHYESVGVHALDGSDPKQLANTLAVALGEGGMKLVFKPSAKQRAGSFRGVIAPNSGWLSEDSGDKGYLLTTGADQLDRLSASQLMTVYTGSMLNALWEPESKSYLKQAKLDAKAQPKLAKDVLKLLKTKLGTNDSTLKLLQQNLDEAVGHLGELFANSNAGKDDLAKHLIDANVDEGPEALQKAQEQAEKWKKIREKALLAQKDDSFTAAPTMADGMWGGKRINPANGKPFRPFRHQCQTMNWMETVKRGIVALDAGMGKTGTIIGFMERLKAKGKAKRAILFLPPSLMQQWPGEIASFAPGSAGEGKILNLAGLSMEERKIALQSDMAKNAEWILLSTGTLSDETEGEEKTDEGLIEALRNLEGAVFIDEVHQGGYKTETGIRHQIAKKIIGEREHAFGLTATPIPNDPIDLFHLTNLFAPGSIGTRDEWVGKLHGVQYNPESKEWEVTNGENIAELNTRIKPFVFSKLITDEDVVEDMGKQLPDLVSDAVDVRPSEERCKVTGLSQLDYVRPGGACEIIAQKKLELMRQRREKSGKEPMSDSAERLAYAGIVYGLKRQAAISPALFDRRYTGPAPKIDHIVNNVLEHFSGGGGKEDKPYIVFSSFPRKAFPILKKRLADAGVDPSCIGEISGVKSASERAFVQDLVNGYQSDEIDQVTGKKKFVPGKYKICLIGTMSGGAGLNLQKAANNGVFLDEPAAPSAKRQAQGRWWRTGQKGVEGPKKGQRVSFCTTVRMTGTPDMSVESGLAGKAVMSAALLGPADPNIFKKRGEEVQKQLGGRVAADKSITTEQMLALLETADVTSFDADTLGEEFNAVNEANVDEFEGVEKHAEAVEERLTPKQKEARSALAKRAPNLTNELDMGIEQKKWRDMMARRGAVQAYDVKLMVAKTHEKAGNTKEAAAAKRAAERIKDMYPEAFGGDKATRSAADKKRDKKFESAVEENRHVHSTQAVKLNKKYKDLADTDWLRLDAAQYMLKETQAFSATELQAAKKVVAAAKKAGVEGKHGFGDWTIGSRSEKEKARQELAKIQPEAKVKTRATKEKKTDSTKKTTGKAPVVETPALNTKLSDPKSLTLFSAVGILKKPEKFSKTEISAARSVVTAAKKAGVYDKLNTHSYHSWRIGDDKKKDLGRKPTAQDRKNGRESLKIASKNQSFAVTKKNPFNKKENGIAHAAHAFLATKKIKTEAHLDDAIGKFADKHEGKLYGAFTGKSGRKKFIDGLKKYLLKEKAVVLAKSFANIPLYLWS